MSAAPDFSALGAAFGFAGLVEARPHGAGHIHDTFLARFERGPAGGAAILQRINERVFGDPGPLMENIVRVTAHQQGKLAGEPDAARRALTVLLTRHGAAWHRDNAGGAWRAYRWIPRARTVDSAASPVDARAAAFAFARFQRQLADLPPPRLHETIPAFHDTVARFDAFAAAVDEDTHGRSAGARDAIAEAARHESLATALRAERAQGLLVERVTHNDTKLNNVLFDEASGEPLCVIDLDTVMPGLPLWDFGDLARSTLLTVEDERDLTRVAASRGHFAALVEGWSAGLGDALAAAERSRLVLAAQLLTYECGLRFLTDHLRGDIYFKIARRRQNLDRARAHFALLRSLIDNEHTLRTLAEG